MAIQFLPLVVAVIGGAATVGAAGYAINNYVQSQREPEEAAISAPQVEPEPAKPEAGEPEVQIAAPQFHILRVEPDGSAVIAGSALPGSQVDILHGDIVIAGTQADAGGDFAIVLDEPLEPGTYELFIRSTPEEGEPVFSLEAGVVHVPERGGEVLAMVTEPGEATKLIQAPETEVAETEPEPEPEQEPEVAAAEPEPEQEVAVVEPEVVEPEPEPEPVVEPEPVLASVMVQAVDVEEGRIFVAGSGEPGHVINIYVNDVFVGATTVGEHGAFLLEADYQLAFGSHSVRADQLSRDGAKVLARAEVPLLHEAPVAVAEAAPEPEPKVEEPQVEIAEAPEPEPEPEPVEVAAAEPEPAAEPSRKVIRSGASVIIRRGDNLWRVSQRTLGLGIRYSTIYDANRDQIRDPNLIFPGQIFKIPSKAEVEATEQG